MNEINDMDMAMQVMQAEADRIALTFAIVTGSNDVHAMDSDTQDAFVMGVASALLMIASATLADAHPMLTRWADEDPKGFMDAVNVAIGHAVEGLRS